MNNQPNSKEVLKIIHECKAPKPLVFEAFSNAAAFAEWWGPAGTPIIILEFEFKQGGRLHYKAYAGGQIMWGLFNYGKIVEPDLIEFINSFSDEGGNVCKAPFPMDFPLEISNRITLQENNGSTILTLESHPLHATPEQEAIFYSMLKNISTGFAATFGQMDAWLSKRQK